MNVYLKYGLWALGAFGILGGLAYWYRQRNTAAAKTLTSEYRAGDVPAAPAPAPYVSTAAEKALVIQNSTVSQSTGANAPNPFLTKA